MNIPPIALFLMLLPIAGQIYVSYGVWQILPYILWLRIVTVSLMALAFLSFFVAMSGWLDKLPLEIATIGYNVGTSWIVVLLYMAILFAIVHICGLLAWIPKQYLHQSYLGTAILCGLLLVLFSYARYHYEDKKRVELVLNGKGKIKEPKKLVLVSDLHLGYHNRRQDLHRWLEQIKAEEPDALLIAGDLIDRTIKPVKEERVEEEFKELSFPVYAIYGNHDYYTGVAADREFCKRAGIKLLKDEIAYFGDIAIIGRDDRTNVQRKTLAQLMDKVDRSKYIIELDHQPYHLEEAEENCVDFEFAGHTHHGQVWPGNWLTEAIYENAYGVSQRKGTTYYVSSGLGIWGAKFRIGTQSEFLVVTFR